MGTFELIAIGIGLFFAINIGASGAAASMGIAYGSGAIKKPLALVLCSLFVFAGAYLGGGEVVTTISKGIVPESALSVMVVVIILASATVTLFIANLMGIPLSTSEVTVGSTVGIGLAMQNLKIAATLKIMSYWIITPVIAFVLAILIGKLIDGLEKKDARWKGESGSGWEKGLLFFVVAAGLWEAFSAGMNNVANAVGPLVGAKILDTDSGILIGGIAVAIGVVTLGGRVLETNGKKITQLSILKGASISTTGGTIVVICSVLGVPVPLTQITTTAIMGLGVATHGKQMFQKSIVTKIIKIWVVSPLLSAVVSYALYKSMIHFDGYGLFILSAALIAVIGLRSLYQTIMDERRAVNEEGAGI